MNEQQLATQNTMPAVSAETQAIMQMIEQIALNPQADVEKLRAVMDMKMQMFNRGAEIEFNAAMARAQAEMLPVVRTAYNQQTKSKYALLENIVEQLSPIWTKHGFALSFDTGDCPTAGYYRVMCECTHAAGFSKNYKADLPADMTGIAGSVNKTGVHGFGSTVSYGRRYLTCMIFNIAVKNDDNDGNQTPRQQQKQPERQRVPITDSKLAEVVAKIQSGEVTISRLLNNHTFTPSQKTVLKAQFPQVQL